MAVAADRSADALASGATRSRVGLEVLLVLIVGYHFLALLAAQLAMPAARSIAVNKAAYMAMELAFIAAAFAVPRLHLPEFRPSRPLRWAIAAWLVTWIVASLQAQNPAMALLHSMEWLVHGAFVLAVWAWSRQNAAGAGRVVSVIRQGFLVYAAILLLFVFALDDPANHRWGTGFPVFHNVRHFGYFTLAALVLGYQPLIGRKARLPALKLLGAAAFLTLAWGLLFWTGSRGAVLAAAVALFGYGVFFAAGFRVRLAAVTVLTAGFGLFAAALFPVADTSLGVHRFLSFLAVEADLPSINRFSASRVAMWQDAWGLLMRSPLVGLGPDQYMLANTPLFRGYVHPHNIFLQFALAWGIVGGGLALFLGGCLLHRLATSARRSGEPGLAHATLLTIAALLLVSLIDGVLYHSQPVMVLAALAGLLLGLGSTQDKDPPTRQHKTAFWRGATVIVALILGLHLASTLAVLGPAPAKPGSLRQTVVQAFPTGMMNWYSEALLARWAEDWQRDDPEAADALLAWAAGKGRRPWAAQLERARHLHASGRHAESQALVKRALAILPPGEEVILDNYAELLPPGYPNSEDRH